MKQSELGETEHYIQQEAGELQKDQHRARVGVWVIYFNPKGM